MNVNDLFGVNISIWAKTSFELSWKRLKIKLQRKGITESEH